MGWTVRTPSAKKLLEAFPDLDAKQARLIRALAKAVSEPEELETLVEKVPATQRYVRSLFSSPYDGSAGWRITVAMHAINEILGGFGVEGLGGSHDRAPLYEYVNMGDTYATTLLYDNDKDRLFISSWGDVVESDPRTGDTSGQSHKRSGQVIESKYKAMDWGERRRANIPNIRKQIAKLTDHGPGDYKWHRLWDTLNDRAEGLYTRVNGNLYAVLYGSYIGAYTATRNNERLDERAGAQADMLKIAEARIAEEPKKKASHQARRAERPRRPKPKPKSKRGQSILNAALRKDR